MTSTSGNFSRERAGFIALLGITATSAHWEQANSSDAGKTWVTNWYMDFARIS